MGVVRRSTGTAVPRGYVATRSGRSTRRDGVAPPEDHDVKREKSLCESRKSHIQGRLARRARRLRKTPPPRWYGLGRWVSGCMTYGHGRDSRIGCFRGLGTVFVGVSHTADRRRDRVRGRCERHRRPGGCDVRRRSRPPIVMPARDLGMVVECGCAVTSDPAGRIATCGCCRRSRRFGCVVTSCDR